MTANLKTQLFDLVGSGQNNKVSKNQKSSGSDFANIMDNSVKSKDSVQEANAPKETINKNQGSVKSDFDKIQQEINKNAVLSSTGTEGSVSTNEIEPLADGSVNVDNISFINIEDFITALQNSIQEQLGISEEELEKAMETLGLTMLDLLNPINLKQLVLQVKGAEDLSEFLTNEDLANTLNQLSEAINSAADDFGVTKEQVEQYLDNINGQANADEFVIAPTSVENSNEEISADEFNVTKDSSAVASENSTTVEVYKTDTKGEQAASDNTGNKDETTGKTSLESFIQNLAVKGNEGTMSFAEEVSNIRQMQDITTQIIEQIKVFIKPEQTSMEIQLNPEHLGKVNLSVVAKDGILTAQFQTQNEIAKEAIESQLHILRENLNQQGLKVEAIEVTVSNFDFTGSDQAAGDAQKQQEKSGNRGRFFEGTDVIEDEKIESSSLDILEQATNSVDYTV
jgi:flagellar hook-length control protein FliK